jgi:hypothetical protein
VSGHELALIIEQLRRIEDTQRALMNAQWLSRYDPDYFICLENDYYDALLATRKEDK